MAAAIDLFAERDYASVTIQDITRRAGATHSLVYYHFKNKDDLFNKAIRNLITQTIEVYREAGEQHHNPVELIEDWFDNNIRLSRVLRKLVKIMFDYSGPQKGRPSVQKAIANFYQEEHRIIAGNIKRGVDEGYFVKVDATRVAAFVSTHIDGIFYDSFIRDDEDIGPAMENLKWVLWSILGYDQNR